MNAVYFDCDKCASIFEYSTYFPICVRRKPVRSNRRSSDFGSAFFGSTLETCIRLISFHDHFVCHNLNITKVWSNLVSIHLFFYKTEVLVTEHVCFALKKRSPHSKRKCRLSNAPAHPRSCLWGCGATSFPVRLQITDNRFSNEFRLFSVFKFSHHRRRRIFVRKQARKVDRSCIFVRPFARSKLDGQTKLNARPADCHVIFVSLLSPKEQSALLFPVWLLLVCIPSILPSTKTPHRS